MDSYLKRFEVIINGPEEEAQHETNWRALRDALRRVLTRFGKEWVPLSDDSGIFLLVEDILFCRMHKVCVIDIAFLSPALVAAIQSCLAEQNRTWGVMFSLELKDPRYTGDGRGLVVTADEVKEYWDRNLLRQQLAGSFLW